MLRPQANDSKPRWIGAAFSLFVHILLIVIVATQLRLTHQGTPGSPFPKAIRLSLAPPTRAPPKVVQPPAPPVPPKPVEPPKEPPKITNEPTPTPVKPPPPKKKPAPTPAPPTAAIAPPKPPGATTQKPAPAPPSPPVETPEESLIGRIHDNWLEPAARPRTFRCQIHIDYLAGGRITAVKLVKSCGDFDLEESVRKAVWKTQLPKTLAAKTVAGSIEIEFTP